MDDLLGPFTGWPWLDTVIYSCPSPMATALSYQVSWSKRPTPPPITNLDLKFVWRDFTGAGTTYAPPRTLELRFRQLAPFERPWLRTSCSNNTGSAASFQISTLIWISNSERPRGY